MPKYRKRRFWFFFLLFAHSLGVISSVDALMSVRTSQGTIAWIVSLNTVPYVAVPAYWIFGRSKFQGYVIARRDEDSVLAAALTDQKAMLRSRYLPEVVESKNLRVIERLAKLPFIDGNRLKLLIDGEDVFDSIFEGMDSANDYILAQFYIIRDDSLGREFQRRLIEHARAGIDVYLLYDEIGSYRLPRRYLDELSEAGVKVHRFHSTRGPGNRFQLNFRNHRKLVVVDGEKGWLGGLNVGDEYLGKDERYGSWRDTHLKLEGPAVLQLQLSFAEDWHWATEEILAVPWEMHYPDDGDIPVLVLPTGPADRFETASLVIQQAIHAAEERIWISSPYFVPDEGVQGMLKLAALGGIDVRILIPEMPDNRLAYHAAYAFIGPLLDAGVKIYRYQDGFLHSKAFLVDDIGAAISTVNLDNRSFRLNFEITAIGLDAGFNEEVEQMFIEDFKRSRLMQLDDIEQLPLWFRIASRAAYLLAPVL